MNKEQLDLAIKVLSFLERTSDKYFNQKSEHDQTIERMHTNEMNTKKRVFRKNHSFRISFSSCRCILLKKQGYKYNNI